VAARMFQPRQMPTDVSDPIDDATLPPDFFAEPRRVRKKAVERLVRRTAVPTHGTMEFIRTSSDGGDPAVVSALTLVVEQDPDVAVKRSAFYGLSRIPDQAAIPGLLPGLRSSDRASRAHAVNGLGRLRARAAVPDLVALLGDWYCAAPAARALLAIRDERALEPLQLAAAQAWPWRRRQLRRCARELESALGYAGQ
jgi:HEAT repeats